MRWFTYQPITPCRPSVYGEGIFVRAWGEAMREPVQYGDDEENERFQSIVSPLSARADDAAVASSFICWLGTNCGRCFLARAESAAKDAKAGSSIPDIYLMTWAIENCRESGMNHNRRTIEAILPAEMINYRSAEIIERVALWLGSHHGRKMVVAANAEIELTGKTLLEMRHRQYRAGETAASVLKHEEDWLAGHAQLEQARNQARAEFEAACAAPDISEGAYNALRVKYHEAQKAYHDAMRLS